MLRHGDLRCWWEHSVLGRQCAVCELLRTACVFDGGGGDDDGICDDGSWCYDECGARGCSGDDGGGGDDDGGGADDDGDG